MSEGSQPTKSVADYEATLSKADTSVASFEHEQVTALQKLRIFLQTFPVAVPIFVALLLLGGVIMYGAQHFLTLAYANADAGFVQPFDDLKLFSNIFVSWLVLNFAPEGSYWLGILLILAGSLYLLWSERRLQTLARAA